MINAATNNVSDVQVGHIPNLTFMTDDGICVTRFFNKYIDCFMGSSYVDVYNEDVSDADMRRINVMMANKPRNYEEYLEYVRSNICAEQ